MAECSKERHGERPQKNNQSSNKVVYAQDDVFVHTSTSAVSNYSANIIRGSISIVEKNNSCFVTWLPASSEAVFDDYDVHSDDTEWNIVSRTQQKTDGQPVKPVNDKVTDFVEKYTLQFDTSSLHSIRRSDSKFHWHFLVFILKDGTTLPALHFHSGGTREFIRHLCRYIWLTKSATNPKLFVACNEHDHALRKSLDHLQLFGSDSADIFSRVIGNAYVEGLGAFSKVTKLVRDVWTQGPDKPPEQQPEDEPMPDPSSQNGDNAHYSLGSDFENLLPDVQPDLGPAPEVELGEPIGMSKWMGFMDMDGKVENVEGFKKLAHKGGIDHSLRKEIWKFLLGYYSYNQTYKERIQTRKEKWNEYVTMKQQWQTISPQQEKNFAVFRERKHLVDKDVIRTDRRHSFYKEDPGNPNMTKLYDILMTYCMYNFDLGYVQGMSDLLSPILFVMDDEADAFWSFVGFMEMVADNFEMKQAAIHKQLDNLKTLIQYVYPRLYHHFEKNESGNLYFCFRWILILFKREFNFDDVMRLWETLWTQDLSPNFLLFLCLAVLKMEKNYIIENQCGFNEILKHINELSMNIDLQTMIVEAERICLQLKEVRNLPDDVQEILTGKPVDRPMKPKDKPNFPGKPVLIQDASDGQTIIDTDTEQGDCSSAQGDDIEILSEDNNDISKDAELLTKYANEEDSEIFVSATQTQPNPDEELVVLSNEDKAVFFK